MIKNRKIKNFLIYPKFQLTLVGINIFILAVTLVLIFTQVITSFNDITIIGERLNLPADSAFFKFLIHQRDLLLTRLYWAAGISLTFATTLIVYFSHKATGPIYRLKTYFQELKENDEVRYPLTFRKGDYYADLPEIVNEGLDKVKK